MAEKSTSSLYNVGDRVILRNLQSALNGEKGTIAQVYADGRYKVCLEKSSDMSISVDHQNVWFDASPKKSTSSLFNVGDRVILRNLQPASLNGGKGTIAQVYADGRYKVHLEKSDISIPLDHQNVWFDPSPPVKWACEYCAAAFSTYTEASSHEAKCMQRGTTNKQSEAQMAKRLKREEEGRRIRAKTSERREDMFALFDISTHIHNMADQCMLNYAVKLKKIQGKGYFPCTTYKGRMSVYFEHTIPSIVVGIRTLSKSFSTFEADAPSHHPYREHEKVLLKCATQLDHIASECRPLYTAIPNIPTELVPETVTVFVRHILQSTIPSLNEAAKNIQDLIAFPEQHEDSGPFYSKRHAIKVAMKHPKGSHARGDAIKDMVHMGIVPSQASLYKAINDVEKGNAIIDSRWKATALYDGKVNHTEETTRWESFIYLPLIPIDCNAKGVPILNEDSVGRLFKPPQLLALNLYTRMKKHVKYWGARMYFSPKQFPTPTNLQNAGKASDKTFKKLKKYILRWFEHAKSPVICNGGKPGSKKFVCQMKRKNKKIDQWTAANHHAISCACCNFSVTVKWDRIGYYIPLYNHTQNCYICETQHTHDLNYIDIYKDVV